MKQCMREGEIEKSGCAGLSRRLNGPSSTPLFVRKLNDASLRLPRNVIFLLTILLFSHIVGVHLVHCRISYKIENIYKFILYIYIYRKRESEINEKRRKRGKEHAREREE